MALTRLESEQSNVKGSQLIGSSTARQISVGSSKPLMHSTCDSSATNRPSKETSSSSASVRFLAWSLNNCESSACKSCATGRLRTGVSLASIQAKKFVGLAKRTLLGGVQHHVFGQLNNRCYLSRSP